MRRSPRSAPPKARTSCRSRGSRSASCGSRIRSRSSRTTSPPTSSREAPGVYPHVSIRDEHAPAAENCGLELAGGSPVGVGTAIATMAQTADLSPTIVEALYSEALELADEVRAAFDLSGRLT